MCNALSPERAVIWALISDRSHFDAVKDVLRPEHFTHGDYQSVFAVCEKAYADGLVLDADSFESVAQDLGLSFDHKSTRAIRRMLRNDPGARQTEHMDRLVDSLIARHLGQPMVLHSLIN